MSEDFKVGYEIDVELEDAIKTIEKFQSAVAKACTQMNRLLGVNDDNTDKANDVNEAFKTLRTSIAKISEISTARFTNNLEEINKQILNAQSAVNSNAFENLATQIKNARDATNSFYKYLEKITKIGEIKIDSSNFSIAPIFEQVQNSMGTIDLESLDVFSKFSNSINSFSNGMQRLGNLEISDNFKSKMKEISDTVSQFTTAFENVKADGINAIVKAMKELPKAMESMQKLDVSKIGQTFDTLTQKLQKFLAELREGSSDIHSFSTIVSAMGKGTNTTSLTSGLQRVQKEIRNTGTESDKTNKKLRNMLSFGKIYALFNQLKHYGTSFGNMLNQAIDFAEVENYFSRAMGNMRSEAMKFQNELSDMFGLAMPSMMQAQATFKNQLGSLGGLSDDVSYMLSERLTKMSLDYASLYNVSIDAAVTKFQAALSKQVKFCPLFMGINSEFLLIAGNLSLYGYGNQQVSIDENKREWSVL